jgi:hypothetical protein
MDKSIIKSRIRTALFERETSKMNSQKRQKDYQEIQSKLDNTLLTKSQVMAAAGLGDADDAGDRRAFNAKVDREKTPEGSIRQFDDKDLAKVTAVVSNPMAYTSKTGK